MCNVWGKFDQRSPIINSKESIYTAHRIDIARCITAYAWRVLLCLLLLQVWIRGFLVYQRACTRVHSSMHASLHAHTYVKRHTQTTPFTQSIDSIIIYAPENVIAALWSLHACVFQCNHKCSERKQRPNTRSFCKRILYLVCVRWLQLDLKSHRSWLIDRDPPFSLERCCFHGVL